jgi:hypothetical protein
MIETTCVAIGIAIGLSLAIVYNRCILRAALKRMDEDQKLVAEFARLVSTRNVEEYNRLILAPPPVPFVQPEYLHQRNGRHHEDD